MLDNLVISKQLDLVSAIVKLKRLTRLRLFYKHFKRIGHSPYNVLVQPVENLSYDKNSTVRFNTIKRFETELKWIKLLQSASPLGFNNIYHGGEISKISDFEMFSLLEFRKRKSRSHGKRQKGNDKRKRCAAQNSNTSLNDLSTKLRKHDRHAMLLFLSSLLIQVISILDIEANRFYNRNHPMYEAALLTRCYTQHALRPLIDSAINYKRHFIKIPFKNKGNGFKYLPWYISE